MVDTLVDESDGDYSPGDLSFREAIELANAARFEGVVDTIHFDPALTANGPAAIVLTQGELKITDSLTINGPGAGLLTIDASGNDPTPDENNNDGSRIFNIDNGIATEINVMIVGLTLTGGDTSGNGGAILSREQLSLIDSAITENVAGSGGGIYAVGSIFVENAEISHNFSENLGGGLTLFVGASRVASISRSSITNNQGGIAGAYQSGGGIFISSTGGSTSITDSVIADNRSLSHGGGIYANVFGPLEIRRCTIARNEGGSGSGIFLSAVGTIASIHNVQIIDNRGVIGRPQGSGAFFRATNSARILFDRCLIKGNSGAYNGGGLFLDSSVGSEIIVSQSVIAKNRAEYGGGVVVSVQDSIYTAPGSVEIAHCTVSGNTGHVGDGGIYMFGDGNFRMTYSTVVENSAEQSILETLGYKPTGGIAINHSGSDPVVIDHVIVARNFAPSTAPSDFEINSAIEVRHSLVGNNSGTQLAEAPVGMPDAHGNLIGGPVHGMIDPLLGPLADNGGFELPDGSRILTHALLAGSPAINAGDLNAVAGEDGVPQFDQRGEPFGRIVGARIDIGAFEYELPTDLNLVVDTLVDESDGDYSRGDLSLREAIELANATRFKGVVDTITFDPALIADGPATILLTQGELKITDSLTISGPGADQLTIDAGGNDPTPDADNADGSRVLNIDDEDPLSQLDVVLRGLTISGGDVDGFGGGVFSAESLEVRRVAVVDNQASSGGGGLAIFLTEEATASFTESTISNNLALGPGGGIYLIHQGSGAVSIAKTKVIGNSVYGTIANGGGLSILLNDETTASLTESTISNNFVRGPGGGMYLIHEGTGAVSIAKTKVIENSTYDTVAFGGGMCVSLGGGNVSLLDNEFGMNSTQGTGGEGGGLLLQARGEGDVRVEGNSFHENSPSGTGGEGGGAKIVHSGSGDVLIEANTFAANTSAGTSGGGGGAYVAHSGSGNLMVDGNTFSANSTRGNGAEGGGLRVGRSGSGQLAVTNNRVLANSTQGTDGSGGGVYVVATGTGSVLVTNNLFDGNKSRGTSAEGGGGYFRHVGSGDLLVTGNTFMRNSILGTSANGGGLAVVRSGTGQAKVYGNTAGGNMAGGTVSTGIGIFVSAISSGVVQLYGNAATDNLLLTPDRGSFGGIGISTSAGGRINAYGNVASRNFGGLSAQGSGTSYVYSNDLTDNVGTGMILSATFAGSVINSYHNVVTGNRSNSSAGGILVSAQLNGKVSVSDTLVAENEAASSGGGIYMFMRLGGAIEIDRTLVSGNQLVGNDIGIDSRGAGVYLRAEDGTFLMKDSTVSGNTALSGAGGIYVTTAITDSVEIRNCTISGNTVGGNGGGLYLKGYVRANQVTVTQNSASAGGGVFVATGGIVANGLITAGNFALIGSDLSGFLGSSLDLHYSLVGNNSASGLAEAPVGSPDAKGNLIGGSTFAKRIDPLLSPLDDNGGFELPNGLRILTHAPLPGSPAINAGDLAAVAGQGFVTLHDQRGAPFTRVFGGRIDIGAVESIPAGFLPGDYRVDGRVDAMDYSVWRDTLGAIVSPGAGADGNGDGLVDERDFTVWKSNFGAMAGQGARHGESLTGGSPRRIFDTEQGEKSRNTNAAADRPLVALDAAALAHQSTQPEWVRARAVLPARSETGARHDQALEAWLSRRRFAIQNEVTLPSTAREANTEGITAVDIAFDQLEAFAKQRRQSWGLSEVRQR
ncbi:MAG: choice-of-anchor Q domain-containing protein [Pirellulales bacterium]